MKQPHLRGGKNTFTRNLFLDQLTRLVRLGERITSRVQAPLGAKRSLWSLIEGVEKSALLSAWRRTGARLIVWPPGATVIAIIIVVLAGVTATALFAHVRFGRRGCRRLGLCHHRRHRRVFRLPPICRGGAGRRCCRHFLFISLLFNLPGPQELRGLWSCNCCGVRCLRLLFETRGCGRCRRLRA